MNKPLCPCCGSADQDKKELNINFKHPVLGVDMCVKNVEFYFCVSCKEDWQSPEQFNKYRKQVIEANEKAELTHMLKIPFKASLWYPRVDKELEKKLKENKREYKFFGIKIREPYSDDY